MKFSCSYIKRIPFWNFQITFFVKKISKIAVKTIARGGGYGKTFFNEIGHSCTAMRYTSNFVENSMILTCIRHAACLDIVKVPDRLHSIGGTYEFPQNLKDSCFIRKGKNKSCFIVSGNI